MFWLGFYSVFSLLGNAIYGYIVFVLLMISIIAVGSSYNAIRKFIKNKLNKETLEKGLLYDKNVIVTGGSSGIGKCLAILAAREGAHVTVVARDQSRLDAAAEAINRARRHKESQRVECLSLDVGASYAEVERQLGELEARQGVCHLLVCCAGSAVCGKIEDTSEETLRRMVELNLLGSYFCAKAVAPGMKQAKEGRIVLVGSQAGLLGIFGYSAYCSTKFALRGLAESLAMELTPHNVHVTLALPPDTDTPGYATEELTKPLETKLISKCAGLVRPEAVAEALLRDALDGKFYSIIGLESFVLTTLCSGMSPYSTFSELMTQALLMGPLRLVSAFMLHSFQNIVVRCMREREKFKKSE